MFFYNCFCTDGHSIRGVHPVAHNGREIDMDTWQGREREREEKKRKERPQTRANYRHEQIKCTKQSQPVAVAVLFFGILTDHKSTTLTPTFLYILRLFKSACCNNQPTFNPPSASPRHSELTSPSSPLFGRRTTLRLRRPGPGIITRFGTS